MKRLLGIIFASIIGLYGCGDDPKSQDNSQSGAASSTSDKPLNTKSSDDTNKADYTPALWKIEYKGTTSYLFGSIHMGEKGMFPLPETVTKAFEESDTIAVEIDLAGVNQMQLAKKVQDMAMDPENPLDTVLTEETLAEYNEYCEETQSPCQMFSTFEPWFAAITLEALSMQKAGYQEQYGIDAYFIERARESKEIVELEDIDSQLGMLDSLPLNLQDMFLYSVVTKEEGETEKLVTAWKTGNVEQYLEESYEEAQEVGIDEEEYDYFMDAFLFKRNQGMADGIADLINQGKAVFAVVGAAHYGGDKSVNHYLKEKGFTIERVNY